MRVLITGSRDWVDYETIESALTAMWIEGGGPQYEEPHLAMVLVSGNARGADRMAEQCWLRMGGGVEGYPADWDRYGRRAGIIRNQAMVDDGADVCLAFIRNGSRGASHCASAAEKAGIDVVIFREDGVTNPYQRILGGWAKTAEPSPAEDPESDKECAWEKCHVRVSKWTDWCCDSHHSLWLRSFYKDGAA